jgi:tripartite-type tricarboxylate transporter receptor subunit TctC
MRHVFKWGALLACALSLAVSAPALAQDFPTKPIKWIVPFPPGGPTDSFSRPVAQKLSEILGQPVVVENVPGAGASIGMDRVAKSAPDGYTIGLASTGTHAINPHLYGARLPHDTSRDFTPLTLGNRYVNVLVVNPKLGINTVAELIAYAKANPGKLTYGSSGIGTSVHLCGELFQKMTGTKMVHVPYRGTAQATQDLIGGRIDLIFDNIPQALPHVRAGSIRGFGITTAKRSPTAPEFAPIADTVPGFDVSSWFALFAPAKTPPAVIAKIQADTKAGIADPAVRAKMDALAAEPVGNSSEELGAFLQAEMKRWGDLIKEVGLKVE